MSTSKLDKVGLQSVWNKFIAALEEVVGSVDTANGTVTDKIRALQTSMLSKVETVDLIITNAANSTVENKESLTEGNVYLNLVKNGVVENSIKMNGVTTDENGQIIVNSGGLTTVDLANDVTGILPVSHGGTGRGTLTANAVLAGDGTNAVKMIVSASGALYATAANGTLTFGTLPVSQGGTGQTNLSDVTVGKASKAVIPTVSTDPSNPEAGEMWILST